MMEPQHDEVMQDILESNASEEVTETRQIATLQMVVPDEAQAEGSQTTINKLVERLGNVGINACRTRLPMKTDGDYDSNARDTFEFLCIVLGSCSAEQLRYEILRKFRMGSRIVHPDKTAHFPSEVVQWASDLMRTLSLAKDEALWRLEHMSAKHQVSHHFIL